MFFDSQTLLICVKKNLHKIAIHYILVVQDRVIAYWFPDKLGLAFGAIVSVIRCGNVLNFFLTSNIAKLYGVPMALWTGN